MYDNKGSILPVTVVSMMVMMIIGLVCLHMFASQNILDTYDQAKIRTFYSAEAAVEMMIGYINYETPLHLEGVESGDSMYGGKGFLFSKTSATGVHWHPLDTASEYPILASECFDGTMYPQVKVSVYCERLSTASIMLAQNSGINLINSVTPDVMLYCDSGEQCAYRIVAIASTTHKTSLASSLIVSSVSYYFCTKRSGTGNPGESDPIVHTKYFVCWRRD